MTTFMERKLETDREERIPDTSLLIQPTRTPSISTLTPHEFDMMLPLSPRVYWGGILSGFVVGFGILILLVTFGLAIGFSATDRAWWMNANAARDMGARAGIWVAIALLVTYFFAAMVSTKVSNRPDRGGAIFQGTILWVLFSVFLCLLVHIGLGSDLAKIAAKTGVVPGSESRSSDFLPEGDDTGNLDVEDSDQMMIRLEDSQVPVMVASMTGISQGEAEAAVKDLQRHIALVRDDPTAVEDTIRTFMSRMGERARQKATETDATVIHNAEVGAWITFGTLAVTLFVSIMGALVGMPGRVRMTNSPLVRL